AVLLAGVWLEGFLVRLPSSASASAIGERIGIIHVHTKASDGSGTIADILDAGRKANLSFIAITDHNVAMDEAALAEDPPDFPLISGEELSTSNGHFETLGIPPRWRHPATQDARTLLAAARAAGGFNLLAHPFSKRIPWTDWGASEYD